MIRVVEQSERTNRGGTAQARVHPWNDTARDYPAGVCVHELVEKLGAPQPLVSQHLRVLRGAGVVRGARRGREIAYSLVDEHVAHIVADAVTHARESRPTAPSDA